MTDDSVMNDIIEQAYWKFDAMRNGYAEWSNLPKSERDAFKAACASVLEAENAQLKADNTHYKKALDIVHLIVEHDDADFSCCSQDIKAEAEEYGLDTLLKLKEKNADLLDNLSRCKGNELAAEVEQLKAELAEARYLQENAESALNTHMEIHARVVNELRAVLEGEGT